MPKNLIKAFFADDGDENEAKPSVVGDGAPKPATDGDGGDAARPRSMADAWDRIAEQNRRLEARLESVEAGQRRLIDVAQTLQDTAKQQLEVLRFLGRFAEASERRGREMETQFRGVPDVLRTLPSATKEQAERLSEIAARLYEKAQDNTVNALRSAQASHERAVEDLIDKSLGATRRATYAAILTAFVAVIASIAIWVRG
ncbi:MAG: hypothetical protein K8T90_21870 [Planctomycetes bacterium]|nr:hypothetical protein [Planctomycetota bacterium]